jgi:hypothetical protein
MSTQTLIDQIEREARDEAKSDIIRMIESIDPGKLLLLKSIVQKFAGTPKNGSPVAQRRVDTEGNNTDSTERGALKKRTLDLLADGGATVSEIAAGVYGEDSPATRKRVSSMVHWLKSEALIELDGERWVLKGQTARTQESAVSKLREGSGPQIVFGYINGAVDPVPMSYLREKLAKETSFSRTVANTAVDRLLELNLISRIQVTGGEPRFFALRQGAH